MPNFFFDIHDEELRPDEEGVALPNLAAVRTMAMRTLPHIAADEIPSDGDDQHFDLLVKDEDGDPIYTATLSYVARWIKKPD